MKASKIRSIKVIILINNYRVGLSSTKETLIICNKLATKDSQQIQIGRLQILKVALLLIPLMQQYRLR